METSPTPLIRPRNLMYASLLGLPGALIGVFSPLLHIFSWSIIFSIAAYFILPRPEYTKYTDGIKLGCYSWLFFFFYFLIGLFIWGGSAAIGDNSFIIIPFFVLPGFPLTLLLSAFMSRGIGKHRVR